MLVFPLDVVLVYDVYSCINRDSAKHYECRQSPLVECKFRKVKSEKQTYERYWNQQYYYKWLHYGFKKDGADKVNYCNNYEQHPEVCCVIEKPAGVTGAGLETQWQHLFVQALHLSFVHSAGKIIRANKIVGHSKAVL